MCVRHLQGGGSYQGVAMTMYIVVYYIYIYGSVVMSLSKRFHTTVFNSRKIGKTEGTKSPLKQTSSNNKRSSIVRNTYDPHIL